jgi:hypothetical protein
MARTISLGEDGILALEQHRSIWPYQYRPKRVVAMLPRPSGNLNSLMQEI